MERSFSSKLELESLEGYLSCLKGKIVSMVLVYNSGYEKFNTLKCFIERCVLNEVNHHKYNDFNAAWKAVFEYIES